MSAQPVVLAGDRLTLSAGTQSLATRIQNTDSIGVLIDKIVFEHWVNPGTQGQLEFFVRLGYQGIPITNGWIPVHSFCWPQAEYAAYLSPTIPLSNPIYLGPGEWIDVSFGSGLIVNADVFVSVSGHGKQAAVPPAEKWLPYFASFLGATRDVNLDGGTFSEVSTPQDLGNPFDVDLKLERLIGVCLAPPALFPSSLAALNPTPWWNFFTVGLTDEADNIWIPNQTPLPNVFNAVTRSWRLNAIMPSRGYLRAQIEGTYIGTDAVTSLKTLRPLLGMVGYRRIFG